MEPQKKDSQEKDLKQSLTVAIQNNGRLDLSVLNRVEISHQLKAFKNPNGGIEYPKLFSIPVDQRIVALSEKDFTLTVKTIAVGISFFLESLNLQRPMTSGQIFDLAEAIIDDAAHDKISLEDILLFMQKLIRGEYGEMYESMDVPKFMKWFSVYRDERWEAGIKIRDAKIEEHKKEGDDNFFERNNRKSPLGEELSRYTTKLEALRDDKELLKRENDRLRSQNNF